jgi:hypothetical protein
MDAPTLVSRLLELDPTFGESVERLFGGRPSVEELTDFAFATGGVSKHDEIVAKMMPAPSDVGTVGRSMKRRRPRARVQKLLKPPKPPKPTASLRRRKTAVGPKQPKTPKVIKPPEPVKPVESDTVLTKRVRVNRGHLKQAKDVLKDPTTAATVPPGVLTGYVIGRNKDKKPQTRQTIYTAKSSQDYLYGKRDEEPEVEWAGEFSKFDEDKRLAFGWASVVALNGEPVLDKQGDLIDPDEIEKAAYKYMLESRKGGEMHKRQMSATGEDEPVHVADIVESFVVTPEKIEKMGLPESMPQGWWVGYKVHDDEAWEKVKKGDYKGFSIHGRGRRTPVEA